MPSYSYHTCTRNQETTTVFPRDVVIIEGILIQGYQPLRDVMDLKVFVDVDADGRLSRVITCDIVERGRDIKQVLYRYHQPVESSHLQFIEPTIRYAD